MLTVLGCLFSQGGEIGAHRLLLQWICHAVHTDQLLWPQRGGPAPFNALGTRLSFRVGRDNSWHWVRNPRVPCQAFAKV